MFKDTKAISLVFKKIVFIYYRKREIIIEQFKLKKFFFEEG